MLIGFQLKSLIQIRLVKCSKTIDLKNQIVSGKIVINRDIKFFNEK